MKTGIIAYQSTKFGELWDLSLHDLMAEAINGILVKTRIESSRIDAVFFGNMLGAVGDRTLLLEAHIAEILGSHIPSYRIEAACASGGLAFQMAHMYLATHPSRTVLVLGAEKMTDLSVDGITSALGLAASDDEQFAGLTFPGLYGIMAHAYLDRYGYSEEHLAAISVKNHAHGIDNENAHFRKYVKIDEVLESPYVARPLKVLDSSPISDGAAALLLTNDATLLKKFPSAYVEACETATDCISLAKRKDLLGLAATREAGKRAFAAAKLTHKDIRVMEVHDCFSIAEIFALEDLGFWKKGEGGARAKEMATHKDSCGEVIVNTSGGLKSAGHPVGGTGIKQIGEIYLQLTSQAGKRQVTHASHGLAHNVGGSGGVAVVTILSV